MAFTLKVDGLEITDYVRTQHEDGLDPADGELLEPVWAGSPALREGQQWAGDAVRNREWTVPLILSADSQDELHALIAEINSRLVRGAQVEWRSAGATQSSFFRLERGRLDPEYEHWVTHHNSVRATLRLWTDPYASTGSARQVVASSAATQAVRVYSVTGIQGDTEALAQLEVRVGSHVASGGRLIAYGVHDSAYYSPFFGPSDSRVQAQSGATVMGASGAVASQVLAIPVSPTTASGIAMRAHLTPPDGHTGRHRVLGIFQSRLTAPITMRAYDRDGQPLGPTAMATQTDPNRWQLVDLGEVNVPARASGMEPVPTQVIDLVAGGAPGAQIQSNGTRALRTQGLVLLPLDRSAGLMLTRGGADSLFADTFTDLDQFQPLSGQWINTDTAAASSVYLVGVLPKSEARAIGQQRLTPALRLGGSYIHSGFELRYLAQVPPAADARLSADLVVAGGSAAASGAAFTLYPKANPTAGNRIALGIVCGPSSARAMVLLDFAVPTVFASAALSASIMAEINAGNQLRAQIGVLGGSATAVLSGAAATQAISANNTSLAQSGVPMVAVRNGAASYNAALGRFDSGAQLGPVTWQALGATAPDIDPREWFRFESYPEPRAIQANASVIKHDRAADFRGEHPRIAPTGSPMASGPAKLVVLAGDPSDFRGNDPLQAELKVLERWRYLR